MTKNNVDLKTVYFFLLTVFAFLSLLLGLIQGSKQACTKESALGRYNIGYQVGCFISKPDFRSLELLEQERKTLLLKKIYQQ